MSNSVTKLPKECSYLSTVVVYCITVDMYRCQGTVAQATFSPTLCKPLGTSWRMLTNKEILLHNCSNPMHLLYAKQLRQVWQNAFQLTHSFFLCSQYIVTSGCKVNCQNMFDSCLWKGQLDTLLWLKLKMQDHPVPNQWVGEGLQTHFYGWSWRTIWYLTTTSCKQCFMINTIQSKSE